MDVTVFEFCIAKVSSAVIFSAFSKTELSSGTQNLEEAIPILEKWFDDIHAESEKLKKQAEENQLMLFKLNNKI